jgi:hypothetical protein
VWILGSLVTLVVAVILTVTLPLAGAQTAPVGTAELIGATGRVLWGEKGQLGWCPSKVQAPPTTVPGSPHSGDSSEPSAQSRSWSHTKCHHRYCCILGTKVEGPSVLFHPQFLPHHLLTVPHPSVLGLEW